ncbi:MAG: hypothetical protein FVQ78_03390 [Solirubrobacterales bacterium]|nr:hypothetical protein [Solirubrobacterales bacterium]
MDTTDHRAAAGEVSAAATGASLVEVAELREQVYLLLGLLFHHPDDVQLDGLTLLAGELRGKQELARDFAFQPALATLLYSLSGLTEARLRALRGEYAKLFQLAADRAPCSLYESAYVDRSGRLAGWVTSSVECSYAAAGFGLSELAGGELPDHAGLELEFMALLCGKEAEARRNGEEDAVLSALGAQRSFLHQHLARWLPEAARRVGRLAAPGSFYGRLADAARAYVLHDRGLVGSSSDRGLLSQAAVLPPER